MSSSRCTHAIRSTKRVASSLSILACLAACADGYPTEDAARKDLAQMGQAELLAELNALGEKAPGRKRWRYTLQPNCELEVNVRRSAEGRRAVLIAGAHVAFETKDGITEIQLVSKAQDAAQATAVLETRGWADSVYARSLLSRLEIICSKSGSPPA